MSYVWLYKALDSMKIGFLGVSARYILVTCKWLAGVLNSDFDKVVGYFKSMEEISTYRIWISLWNDKRYNFTFGDKCCLSKDELLVDGTHYSYKEYYL